MWRLSSGARASNGFEALRQLDSNGDGVVSDRDRRWGDLLLWVDADHDGASGPGEVQPITSSSVRAFDTAYHWTGRTDVHGNFFRYQSLATVGAARRPIYDVYFRVVP